MTWYMAELRCLSVTTLQCFARRKPATTRRALLWSLVPVPLREQKCMKCLGIPHPLSHIFQELIKMPIQHSVGFQATSAVPLQEDIVSLRNEFKQNSSASTNFETSIKFRVWSKATKNNPEMNTLCLGASQWLYPQNNNFAASYMLAHNLLFKWNEDGLS